MPVNTIPDLFFEACERYDKPDAAMVPQDGRFVPRAHRDWRADVENFAKGLIALGLAPREHVAILAETRYEWTVADLAILSAGAVDVPLYPTLSETQILWHLDHSDAIGIIVSTREQAKKFLAVGDQCRRLRFAIVMEELELPGFETMTAVIERGRAEPSDTLAQRRAGIQPKDPMTIIYTSGTTGEPKGVVLSHENLIANLSSCMEITPFTPEDIHLAHLPLSHVFERMGGYYLAVHCGMTIAYARDVSTVADDMLSVRPTVLFSVPRLFEKIFARVHANAAAAGFIKRSVFNWAIAIAIKAAPALNAGQPLSGWLSKKWNWADKLVYAKVKEKTGGRLKFMISGGAPLAKEISETFLGMGMTIVEGYGLTESAPVLTINPQDRNRPGTVGPPLSNVQLHIAEDGEILARGPNVMLGYYKNPEATAATIVDGWLCTGDVGMIDDAGYLRITDRKKDIIVMSNGKNLAPAPIESALKLSPFIEQAVVIGEQHNFITALIVPPWDTVREWAPAQNWPTDPQVLIDNAEFREFIAQEVHERTKAFARFEQIKLFSLVPSPFTVETGELTPSLKVRRRAVEATYRAMIDKMYG